MQSRSFHKTLLIRILEHLQGYWSLAKGFLQVTEKIDNEAFILKLYQTIRSKIRMISNQQEKQRIQEQLSHLYRQQRSQAPALAQDHQDAEQLLDSLFYNT